MSTPPKAPLNERLIRAILTIGGGTILAGAISGVLNLGDIGTALVYVGLIGTALYLVWSTWNNPS